MKFWSKKNKSETSGEGIRFSPDPYVNALIGVFFVAGVYAIGKAISSDDGSDTGGYPVAVSSRLVGDAPSDLKGAAMREVYSGFIEYEIKASGCLDGKSYIFKSGFPHAYMGVGLRGCELAITALTVQNEVFIAAGKDLAISKGKTVYVRSLNDPDFSLAVTLHETLSPQGVRRGDRLTVGLHEALEKH